MKSKEKSKFKPLFIASLSSNDIYNLISPNGDFYATPIYTNTTIIFEIYKKVTISGIKIFSSFDFFPRSFDIEIENKTVASIRDAHELNESYSNMTINFDPIKSNKIKFIQKGRNWQGHSYCIYLKRIELISTEHEYSNGVFNTFLNQNKNDPHRCGVFISSSDFDFNSFYRNGTENSLFTLPLENSYFQIEFTECFAVLNGYRFGRYPFHKLRNYRIIATTDKEKPLDEWITLIEINEKTENEHKINDIYKFNQTSPPVKFVRLVPTGPNWSNYSILIFNHFDFFGQCFLDH